MSEALVSNPALEAFFDEFTPESHPVIAHSTQGLIVRVRAGGLDMAVKTPSGRGPARWLHTLALRREYRAYCRLAGVQGFPACYGLYAGSYLALQFMEGRPLKGNTPDDPDHFFRQLLEIIELMHSRGVAHSDLKSKHNILITPGDEPCIIDLGASVIRKPGWRPLNHRLFDYMRRIDRNSWIKLKYGGYEQISEADRHLLDTSIIERINRLRRRR